MLNKTAAGSLRTYISEMLHELIDFRELLVRMTVRDLLLRYKQTVMGFGWAIFMPAAEHAVFSVVFTRVAPVQTLGAVSAVRLSAA